MGKTIEDWFSKNDWDTYPITFEKNFDTLDGADSAYALFVEAVQKIEELSK
jgi:hypothetical protein